MPTDMEGTPFVFAAWVTGRREGVLFGRVIDKDPFEPVAAYGIEDCEVSLSGAPELAVGSVILSDRATLCAVFGREGFHVEGGSWSIGLAGNEDEALSLVGRSVCPGEWPDPRTVLPSEEDMQPCEIIDIDVGKGWALTS